MDGPNGGRTNVTGTLPFEMVLLPSLETLAIPDEYLRGSIPKEWSAMTSLSKLPGEVNIDILSRLIPLLFCSCSGQLLLAANFLTGTFPDYLFGKHSAIKRIQLAGNKFNGTLLPFESSTL